MKLLSIDHKNKRIETLQQRLDNIEEQYRSQTQEMYQKEKVINCNNETIKNLQQKLSNIDPQGVVFYSLVPDQHFCQNQF